MSLPQARARTRRLALAVYPVVLCALTLGMVVGCASGTAPLGPGKTGGSGVAAITVNPDPVALAVGDSMALTATARDSSGKTVTGATFTWSTSDTLRARVSASGVLAGASAGLDTVIVGVGAVTARVPVTVSPSGQLTVSRVPLGVGGIGCLLSPSGAASCWGFGLVAALGNGTTNTSAAPVPVSGGHVFSAISVGFWSTCGLTAAGLAWCWGNDLDGALGDGAPGTVALVPVAVQGGPFTMIAAGMANACAIGVGGEGYCWGDNDYGAIGDGTTTDRPTPTRVAGALDLATISVGEDAGCGVTVQGDGYCWGTNTLGTLGSGNTKTSYVPAAVAGGHIWRTIFMAGAGACGLTTGGAAYCWGLSEQDGGGVSTTPMLVSGALVFQTIAMGGDQACGLTASGVAYCWGANLYGERGTGGSWAATTTPKAVLGGLTFTDLAAGAEATCGRTPNGAVYCWGAELGTNTITSPAKTTPSPLQLVGPGST